MDTRGFRAMLLTISDKLTEDNVVSLKFLCLDIGKKRLEKINKGFDLFECLIERAQIGPDNTDLLRKLLNDIGQTVLLEIVEDYERQAARPADGLDAKERGLYGFTELLLFMLHLCGCSMTVKYDKAVKTAAAGYFCLTL